MTDNIVNIVGDDKGVSIFSPYELKRQFTPCLITLKRSDFQTGFASCLQNNPVSIAEQKSLRFGGDINSNSVCAVSCKV